MTSVSPRILLASRIMITTFFVMAVSVAPAWANGYVFPTTNAANAGAGLPHVAVGSTGSGEVTLDFVNVTNSLAFFEYRIDGQVLTTGSAHPVVIGDVIYPGICVDTRTVGPAGGCMANATASTFHARSVVEVRLALGGERDWDFDWTIFTVDPITKSACKGGGWMQWGFANQGECVNFAK